MFDLTKMFDNPQAREMAFKMFAQQMTKMPPEKREALSRVTVTVEKWDRGFSVAFGPSDNEEVESQISGNVDSWVEMAARMFQTSGFRVKIVE